MRYALLLTVLMSAGVSVHAEELYQGRPLEYWATALKSAKDDDAGYAAAQAVAAFGPVAAPYMPLIEPFLSSHQDGEGHGGVSRALVNLWPLSRPTLQRWLAEATAHRRAHPDHEFSAGPIAGPDQPCLICNRDYTLGVALEKLGPVAIDLIPDIEALMRVGRWSVRSWGGSALLAMGEAGQQSMFRLLREPDSGLCHDVLWHLGYDFYDRVDLTKILAEGLFNPDPAVRSCMAGDLAYHDLKPVMPRIIAALRHRDPAIREITVAVLGMAPPTPEGLAHLRRAFADPVPAVREEAAFALLEYAEKLPQARRMLLQRRRDPLLAVRMCAALAAFRAGGEPQPAIAALVERIRQTKGDSRNWAIDQLKEIGPPAVVALPQIIHLLRDENSGHDVEELLRELGEPAVPILLRRWVTAADSAAERDTLVSALEPFVNKNERVAQVLLHVVDDPADAVVFRLFDCLGSGPVEPGPNAARIISRCLRSNRQVAVRGALYAVHVAAPLTDEDARRVIELMKSPDNETASSAVHACRFIPEHAAETVPLLVASARRGNEQFPWGALDVLVDLGSKRPEAVAAVLELARNDNVAMRRMIVSRLAWRREAVYNAAARAALGDSDVSVRRAAAQGLARQGTVDEAVARELIAALHDEKGPYQPMYLSAFAKAKPLSAPLKAQLASLMAADDARVATWAAIAYAKGADDPAAAIPVLLRSLADLGPIADDSFQVLGRLGEPLRAYKADLLGMLTSRCAETRLSAAFLLAKHCGEAEVAVPLLLKELEFGTTDSAYFAAHSLANLAEMTKPYLPQLQRLQAKPLPQSFEGPTPNETLRELVRAHVSGDYSFMRDFPLPRRPRS